MSAFVDESCEVMTSGDDSSGSIFFASCFPSSTPHWSKLKMFQMKKDKEAEEAAMDRASIEVNLGEEAIL